MESNGFSTLISLLSTGPQSDLLTAHTLNSASEKLLLNSNQKESKLFNLNQKEKKKAAFDNWHKRKLDELQKSSTNGSKNNFVATTDDRSRADSTSSTSSSSINVEITSIQPPSTMSLIQQFVSSTTIQSPTSETKALFPNPKCARPGSSNSPKDLTSPKLSRHNDAAFYPNIQCILCKEWVCSRNRYMHIESHLQYRPYKCSVCNYDNRKKIFIELHIKRMHKGSVATVVYKPDSELEKRAWIMAEQCLQHTRGVLLNGHLSAKRSPEKERPSSISNHEHHQDRSLLDKSLLAPYEDVYRPKIFNSQRNEKSLLIEESRQLGLIPDFSEVANREECCRVCKSYILRSSSLLEEHVRIHMSQPTYGCTFDECDIKHCSRNFIFRHMKEVHKMRKNVQDLMESLPTLMDEFIFLCRYCFPSFFNETPSNRELNMQKRKYFDTNQSKDQAKKLKPNNGVAGDEDSCCIGCQLGLNLYANDRTCVECLTPSAKPKGRSFCLLCAKFVPGDFGLIQLHALEHCPQAPFACSLCSYFSYSAKSIQNHIISAHPDQKANSIKSLVEFAWSKLDWRSIWSKVCALCFGKNNVNGQQLDKGGSIYEQICCLCLANVKGGYEVLLDHTLKHLSCPKFACLYCAFESDRECSVVEHVKDEHPTMCPISRIDVTQESIEERGRLLALCFPDVKPRPWWTPSLTQTSPSVVQPASIVCKLCHDSLPFNEHECLRHVEKHITDPIFQCHFCQYKDVDVNRVKNHAQHMHHCPLYSKLTLNNELTAKFTQLMNFCFA